MSHAFFSAFQGSLAEQHQEAAQPAAQQPPAMLCWYCNTQACKRPSVGLACSAAAQNCGGQASGYNCSCLGVLAGLVRCGIREWVTL